MSSSHPVTDHYFSSSFVRIGRRFDSHAAQNIGCRARTSFLRAQWFHDVLHQIEVNIHRRQIIIIIVVVVQIIVFVQRGFGGFLRRRSYVFMLLGLLALCLELKRNRLFNKMFLHFSSYFSTNNQSQNYRQVFEVTPVSKTITNMHCWQTHTDKLSMPRKRKLRFLVCGHWNDHSSQFVPWSWCWRGSVFQNFSRLQFWITLCPLCPCSLLWLVLSRHAGAFLWSLFLSIYFLISLVS